MNIAQPKELRNNLKNGGGTENLAKPFLKWVGGKRQLLHELEKYYPFENGANVKYAEPFIGGGALLFDILNKHSPTETYISDTNKELINAYIAVRDNVKGLIEKLEEMQSDYLTLDTDEKKAYYLQKRKCFNEASVEGSVEKAALMIFLNKTCFNGLFRVNKRGQFNVPAGAYKNPKICDKTNLRAVSEKLQKVTITHGDYRESEKFIDNDTFVYLDPPYRPITKTAKFTAYTKTPFEDKEQIELAEFIDRIHKKGAKILLSNSDPQNINLEDAFFDKLYKKYKIERVAANRIINCDKNKRGEIKELIISNF